MECLERQQNNPTIFQTVEATLLISHNLLVILKAGTTPILQQPTLLTEYEMYMPRNHIHPFQVLFLLGYPLQEAGEHRYQINIWNSNWFKIIYPGR
jgi:hypothetical protein